MLFLNFKIESFYTIMIFFYIFRDTGKVYSSKNRVVINNPHQTNEMNVDNASESTILEICVFQSF